MGEMASTLAHELNQPLSAIANYLQGCGRLLEPVEHRNVPKIRDALAETTKQTLRAGHIIRQLREFVARGETEKRPENISKLVEEASALALVGAKEEGVKSLFELRSHADTVLVDQVQIQQVLLNLMRNAIEAMQDSERSELLVATKSRRRRHGRGQRRRHRPGLSRGDRRAAVPAFRDHQAGTAWASGCRSPSASSRRMAGGCGPSPTRAAAPSSASPCNRRPRPEQPMHDDRIVHIVDDDEAVRALARLPA